MSVRSIQPQQPHNPDTLEEFKLPSRQFAIGVVVLFTIGIVSVCIILTRLHYTNLLDVAHRNLHNLSVIEEQFTQHLLDDLDELTLALAFELQESGLDVEAIISHYNAFIEPNSILQNLLIVDADGKIIFDSRPEQPALSMNVADQMYYSVHRTQRLDELYIDQPVQSRIDGAWSLPMSRAIYDDNGDLKHVIVVSVSPLLWSDTLNDFDVLKESVGILSRDDGIVLTTFPYVESLIGTQLPNNRLSTLEHSTEDVNLLPSFVNDTPTLMEITPVGELPVNLIIEVVNTEAIRFHFDGFVVVIILIAFVTVASSVAVLLLYLRQHDALHLQTDNIRHTNLSLQQEILLRNEVEFTLRASEERYRTVTELISDYAFSTIVHVDGTLNFEWVTESFYTMTGYDPKEFRSLFKFTTPTHTHPDDEERVKHDIECTLRGDETITVYRYQIKSGDYIWLRVKRHPIWDEDAGRVVRFIGATSNITAEKEAELARRESEERYRTVAELMSDFAYVSTVNDDGTLQLDWATDSVSTMTGYTQEELNSLPPKIRAHPDDLELITRDLDLTLAGQKTESEYRTRTKAGEYIWIQTKRRPIWNEDKTKVVRFIGLVTNITSRKEAELALRESEERYRTVAELMSDFAYSTSVKADGTLQKDWVTDSISAMIGYTEEEIGPLLAPVSRTHPDDVELVKRDLELTLLGQETLTEYRTQTKSGDYIWIRTKRRPIWDENKAQVVGFIGVVSNITTTKEVELALRESEDRYRRISNALSDFAYEYHVSPDGSIYTEWVVGGSENKRLRPNMITHLKQVEENAHPDDRLNVRVNLKRTMENHRAITEYRISQESGYRWVRSTREPIWDEDEQRVVRILGTVKDITAEKEAELALQISEERYREVTELMSDYAYSMNIAIQDNLQFEWIVGSLEQITGITIEDAVNDSSCLIEVTHPDDYMLVVKDFEQMQKGDETSAEIRIIHAKTKDIHWLRVTNKPMWNEKGTQVIRVLAGVTDITAQKEAEIALQQSEEQYRLVSEMISDYVYSTKIYDDYVSKIDWVAGSYESIMGVSIDDIHEESQFPSQTHPDDSARVLQDIRKTHDGEMTISEYRVINAQDQSVHWVRVSRQPVWDDAHERVIKIMGAASDITAQKLAEIALRDSEERYRVLTELLTDYAFSNRVEEDGRLYTEWLIGDFESIGGYAIQPSGYADDLNVQTFYTENAGVMQSDIDRTLQGEPTVGEYQIINKKDNKPRWIRMTRQPIWNKDHSKVIRYIGAVNDITLEKEAELISREADQLRQDLEREKGLHELRSRFVSMVTHEFRNPLAAIQSSASILHKYAERLSDESRQEKFDRIYGQIDRLTNLLEDLLQVSELEDHVLHFSPQRIDIIHIIKDLYVEYADSIGQEHNLVLESDLHKAVTYGDAQFLRQALGNIMSNAIKYSPANSDVTCNVIVEDQQIVIHVIDEGMGIPQKDYDQLFKAFYRASNVSTQPGTGLGLLIAQQAIELHHGTVSFTSEVGKGTQFIITIPQVIGKEGDT